MSGYYNLILILFGSFRSHPDSSEWRELATFDVKDSSEPIVYLVDQLYFGLGKHIPAHSV